MNDSEKLDLILLKMQSMEDRMQSMEDRMQSMEEKVQCLQVIEKRLISLEITLENVTNNNIRTIAEGHLDLTRKLDEALKVENEKEMLIIRVRILEDELRKVKDSLEQIA